MSSLGKVTPIGHSIPMVILIPKLPLSLRCKSGVVDLSMGMGIHNFLSGVGFVIVEKKISLLKRRVLPQYKIVPFHDGFSIVSGQPNLHE